MSRSPWRDRVELIGHLLLVLLYVPLDFWAMRALEARCFWAWLRGKRFDIGTWQEVERG